MIDKLVFLCAAIVLGIVGFTVFASRPEIEPVPSAVSGNYDLAVIKRGAQLVAIGNCITCHTAKGGKRLAGGLPITTSYGTVYSTNIAPDPATGIGWWSEQAFRRAMHEGVDRQGQHLYPVFPYTHFRLVSDSDIRAIYAYLMTRSPVWVDEPSNDLIFPFNLRMLIAGWKLLYLDEPAYRPNPSQSNARTDSLGRGQPGSLSAARMA